MGSLPPRPQPRSPRMGGREASWGATWSYASWIAPGVKPGRYRVSKQYAMDPRKSAWSRCGRCWRTCLVVGKRSRGRQRVSGTRGRAGRENSQSRQNACQPSRKTLVPDQTGVRPIRPTPSARVPIGKGRLAGSLRAVGHRRGEGDLAVAGVVGRGDLIVEDRCRRDQGLDGGYRGGEQAIGAAVVDRHG